MTPQQESTGSQPPRQLPEKKPAAQSAGAIDLQALAERVLQLLKEEAWLERERQARR